MKIPTSLFLLGMLLTLPRHAVQGEVTAAYCTPTSNCSQGDFINKVTINGRSSPTLTCGTAGYLSSTYAFTVRAASKIPFTLVHDNFDQYTQIFIDLNGDGNFSSSEIIYNSTTRVVTRTDNFSIPNTGSSNLITKIRFRSSYYPFANTNPCENLSLGSTIDFSITILPRQLYLKLDNMCVSGSTFNT